MRGAEEIGWMCVPSLVTVAGFHDPVPNDGLIHNNLPGVETK